MGGTPLRSALEYAKRYGWPVFPGTVFNGQKVPLVEHGLQMPRRIRRL